MEILERTSVGLVYKYGRCRSFVCGRGGGRTRDYHDLYQVLEHLVNAGIDGTIIFCAPGYSIPQRLKTKFENSRGDYKSMATGCSKA